MRSPRLLDVLAQEIVELESDDLDRVVDVLMPLLNRVVSRHEVDIVKNEGPDGWLTARAAAAYLGLTIDALHKHTAARTIPFQQDGPGCKLWFRRSELDAWRRREPPVGADARRPRFQIASK